ncbi:HK97 family phage prohead protease [Oryzobacter sp. R7]|uniref:HK97 family phage prohead protease n=1 Tax=Oryzobacter faecalis TaxID=3388656 RepID=UPI00398D37C5
MSDAIQRVYEAAAQARADQVRSAGDRPSQRRGGELPGTTPLVRVKAERIELRAADGDGKLLHFNGFASVYNRGYEMWDMFGPYTEQVSSGAGAESLAKPDLDVPLVLQHESLRRIARTTNGTLTLAETTVDDVEGLLTDAPALDPRDADVAYIVPKLESGLIDEMSFRFMITKGSWSPDWMEYHIEGYDIHRGDVAIVGYGANPHTQGAGLRTKQLPLAERTEADLRQLERDVKAELYRRGHLAGLDPATAPAMSREELERIARSTLIAPRA